MRVLYGACPLCDSSKISNLMTADCTRSLSYHKDLPPTMQWMVCEDCRHVFTEGYWTPEAMDLVLSQTHDNQKPGAEMEQSRFVSSDIVDKILPHKDNGRWLDVGFGNGSLMFTAAEYGFEVVGLDLRPETVAVMKSAGFNAHCSDVTDFKDDQFYEVISMADCLEHTKYPKEALKSCRELLIRGGVLFLSMPNMGAPLWDFLNHANANPYWGEIEHYHNFSRVRLYELLNEARFKVINYGVSKRYRVCMEIIAKAI